MTKTTEEIDQLMENWKKDPSWDIEDTEGFEEHREDLKKWRQYMEGTWEDDRKAKKKAEENKTVNEIIHDLRKELGYSDDRIGLMEAKGIDTDRIYLEMWVVQNIQTKAWLMLVEQVKRVADQLEDNENNRMGEADAKFTQELYRHSI